MSYTIRPRLRVTDDDGIVVLGPGKADLLDAIAKLGTIRAAAGELGMSYMRAWTLVRTMNAAFPSPLVEKERGGHDQGARLTDRGIRVLKLYRRMEEKATKAIAPLWEKLQEEL
jgi:molybdate transport system regulatory protein